MRYKHFDYGAITLYDVAFQQLNLYLQFVTHLEIYDSALQPQSCKHAGLGCYVFARRYLRNTDQFLFLRLLRCFTSAGAHNDTAVKVLRHYPKRVSSFRDLRIEGYQAPPRSLSQPDRVFHRFLEPRHPPYALNFILLGNVSTTLPNFVTSIRDTCLL